ncbi:hypothetical protein VFPPC_18370 [Pochonia chlamydosporia 170]|uniref:Uncharacterized protein n=1 Tax=Pochonia chlamydosporia 170 TaxID=1380566 RepID=A0A219ANJ6_METCM|nr:hypothetical protein VFPPC_18370 [Pochonia chlamydosporia 170]OWT42420.1 hypothetical protein VFPPC_18370 [Pochonia chlamydosporia 170]
MSTSAPKISTKYIDDVEPRLKTRGTLKLMSVSWPYMPIASGNFPWASKLSVLVCQHDHCMAGRTQSSEGSLALGNRATVQKKDAEFGFIGETDGHASCCREAPIHYDWYDVNIAEKSSQCPVLKWLILKGACWPRSSGSTQEVDKHSRTW